MNAAAVANLKALAPKAPVWLAVQDGDSTGKWIPGVFIKHVTGVFGQPCNMLEVQVDTLDFRYTPVDTAWKNVRPMAVGDVVSWWNPIFGGWNIGKLVEVNAVDDDYPENTVVVAWDYTDPAESMNPLELHLLDREGEFRHCMKNTPVPNWFSKMVEAGNLEDWTEHNDDCPRYRIQDSILVDDYSRSNGGNAGYECVWVDSPAGEGSDRYEVVAYNREHENEGSVFSTNSLDYVIAWMIQQGYSFTPRA